MEKCTECKEEYESDALFFDNGKCVKCNDKASGITECRICFTPFPSSNAGVDGMCKNCSNPPIIKTICGECKHEIEDSEKVWSCEVCGKKTCNDLDCYVDLADEIGSVATLETPKLCPGIENVEIVCYTCAKKAGYKVM